MSRQGLVHIRSGSTALTHATLAALEVLQQQRTEGVEELFAIAKDATQGDLLTQAQLRMAKALLAAARGEFDEAIGLALEAVNILGSTDAPLDKAETYVVLGEVSRAAENDEEARRAFSDALALFKAKEATACGERVRRLLENHAAPSA